MSSRQGEGLAAKTASLEKHCWEKFVMGQDQKQVCGSPLPAQGIEESDCSLSERDPGLQAVRSISCSPGRIKGYGCRTRCNLRLQS